MGLARVADEYKSGLGVPFQMERLPAGGTMTNSAAQPAISMLEAILYDEQYCLSNDSNAEQPADKLSFSVNRFCHILYVVLNSLPM